MEDGGRAFLRQVVEGLTNQGTSLHHPPPPQRHGGSGDIKPFICRRLSRQLSRGFPLQRASPGKHKAQINFSIKQQLLAECFLAPLRTRGRPPEFPLIFKRQPNSGFFFCLTNCSFPYFFFHQLGGSFLLGVGVWVLVDPTGFREIVAANPLLFTGVYIILGMGGMLFLLGFLGCCGAIRENKCLLLFVSG